MGLWCIQFHLRSCVSKKNCVVIFTLFIMFIPREHVDVFAKFYVATLSITILCETLMVYRIGHMVHILSQVPRLYLFHVYVWLLIDPIICREDERDKQCVIVSCHNPYSNGFCGCEIPWFRSAMWYVEWA